MKAEMMSDMQLYSSSLIDCFRISMSVSSSTSALVTILIFSPLAFSRLSTSVESSSNQPSRSATRWRFSHPGQRTSTTPLLYACLLIVLADRVSQTVHVYSMTNLSPEDSTPGGSVALSLGGSPPDKSPNDRRWSRAEARKQLHLGKAARCSERAIASTRRRSGE